MHRSVQEISQVLIDWGTSSFRLWGVDERDAVQVEHIGKLGMQKLKSSDYENTLEEILSKLEIRSNVPVLVCGMAGAAQGWQEAEYIDLPTSLEDLPNKAVKVKTAARDVRILPGLAQRLETSPDVMRGEETLLLGAILAKQKYKAYCIPGTHSKWVTMNEGVVEKFYTYMTGELFNLLVEYSTLSYFLNAKSENLHEHPEFQKAVLEVASDPKSLSHSVFSIRSGSMLFQKKDHYAPLARLSGLLIGDELVTMSSPCNGKIGLIANGVLSDNYAKAMNALDIDFEIIDSHQLALTGLKFCATKIWAK